MVVRHFFTYILTNPTKSVLYVGMTNDMAARLIEHYLARGTMSSFCGRYNCYNLIYYEVYYSAFDALYREKVMKGWTRKKKEELIAEFNPEFRFLNAEFVTWPPTEEVIAEHRRFGSWN